MTAVVLRADARSLPLPDASVDLIVTSPPFWQLRSYTDGGVHYDGQIGSEPTWQEYIGSLLDCTREWMRVLKPTGSLFVELGDKYAGGGGQWDGDERDLSRRPGRGRGKVAGGGKRYGFRPKCLLDLPHRYAIRCVDDLGLILRAEIVWHHKNGLPESVTDRVRRAHSVVSHFTLRPRYYAATDEVREPHIGARPGAGGLTNGAWAEQRGHSPGAIGKQFASVNPLGKLPGSVWDIASQPLIVPESLGISHFAAFPVELPRRIIAGWSPPGICCECGEGRRPVTEGEYRKHRPSGGPMSRIERGNKVHDGGAGQWGTFGTNLRRDVAITGYACACTQPDAPTRAALVVDPFGGTGTTALAAHALGRTGIACDLSMDYARLARWRCSDPGEIARALEVPRPAPVSEDQQALFEVTR